MSLALHPAASASRIASKLRSRNKPPLAGEKPGKKKCLTSGRVGWGEAIAWQPSAQDSAVRYSRLIQQGFCVAAAIAAIHGPGSSQANASIMTSPTQSTATDSAQWTISTPWQH